MVAIEKILSGQFPIGIDAVLTTPQWLDFVSAPIQELFIKWLNMLIKINRLSTDIYKNNITPEGGPQFD